MSTGEAEYCPDCSRRKHLYTRGRAAFEYDSVMKESISRFKYKNRREYGDFYVQEILKSCEEAVRSWNIDLIVPIPLHKSRRRKRGFNQAELLAREVAKGLCMEYRPLLVKAKNNQIQHSLGMEERAKNVQGVYRAVNREEIEGKRILLVDDIFTTGATMGECAKTLTDSGAAVVVGASLAWVPR